MQRIEYPKHVFLILLSEFCERCSYYGMKVVIALYLKNVLNHNEDTTTTIYHVFIALCYSAPLLGGMISDSWLGKYKTILYLSILYTFGHGILTLGAITIFDLPHDLLTVVGIIFVACGMGGMKPCIAAFGADQFNPQDQKKELSSFFSIFYFAINTGSSTAILISPLLRKNVKCFGMDTCYPLSFGLPCVLMIISMVLLASGNPYYTYMKPEGNIFKNVIMCTYYALREKFYAIRIKGGKEQSEKLHWLEYANGKYSTEFIDDLKQFYRIILILTPAPIFWSLFDQQGSKWLYQATKLNGHVEVLGITLKPDQILILNPLLMVLLIVIFQKCIYPALGKIGWLKTSLQRMTVGGIIIGISFIVAGVLEMELDKESTTYTMQHNESRVNFISNIPCLINVKLVDDDRQLKMNAYDQSSFDKVATGKVYNLLFAPAENCTNIQPTFYKWKSITSKVETLFVTEKNGQLFILKSNYADKIEKNGEGLPLIRFAFLGTDDERESGAVLKIKNEKNESMKVWIEKNDFSEGTFKRAELASISVPQLDTPTYRTETYWHVLELQFGNESFTIGKVFPRQGGNYLFVIDKLPTDNKYQLREYILTIPNKIHILWLFPQYLLLTIAEVMFKISGCEFAFTEAPANMKSLLQAMWLLTVAFGNVIVIIFTKVQVCDKQFNEFFMYAAIMFIAAVSFAILARQYKGINSDKPAAAGQTGENTGSQDLSVMHSEQSENIK